jgi:hypothetical protein
MRLQGNSQQAGDLSPVRMCVATVQNDGRATFRCSFRFRENPLKIVALGLQHNRLAVEDGGHGLFRQALFPLWIRHAAAGGLLPGTRRQQDYGRNGQ